LVRVAASRPGRCACGSHVLTVRADRRVFTEVSTRPYCRRVCLLSSVRVPWIGRFWQNGGTSEPSERQAIASGSAVVGLLRFSVQHERTKPRDGRREEGDRESQTETERERDPRGSRSGCERVERDRRRASRTDGKAFHAAAAGPWPAAACPSVRGPRRTMRRDVDLATDEGGNGCKSIARPRPA